MGSGINLTASNVGAVLCKKHLFQLLKYGKKDVRMQCINCGKIMQSSE